MREMPVRRAQGWLPNVCGLIGAFFSVGILYLPQVRPATGWIIASDILLITGFTASVLILSRLGKAFAILPQARVLMTSGPYALVRHPLYGVEIVVMLGNVILFQQPWALLLGAVTIALQMGRAHFEEQVLLAAFPEYAAYQARTRRFIPGLI